MPTLPPRQCTQPRCNAMQTNRGRCDDHQQVGGWKHTKTKQERYGTNWNKIRRGIMVRDNYLCQCCARAGRTTAAASVDHIKPKSEGGQDFDSNLEAICKKCHDEKTRQESTRGRRRNAGQ